MAKSKSGDGEKQKETNLFCGPLYFKRKELSFSLSFCFQMFNSLNGLNLEESERLLKNMSIMSQCGGRERAEDTIVAGVAVLKGGR